MNGEHFSALTENQTRHFVIRCQYSIAVVFTAGITAGNVNAMSKYSLPRREYCDGPKKMVSMRLPEKLIREVDDIAEAYGWTGTDVISTALDQFIQWAKKKQEGQ